MKDLLKRLQSAPCTLCSRRKVDINFRYIHIVCVSDIILYDKVNIFESPKRVIEKNRTVML